MPYQIVSRYHHASTDSQWHCTKATTNRNVNHKFRAISPLTAISILLNRNNRSNIASKVNDFNTDFRQIWTAKRWHLFLHKVRYFCWERQSALSVSYMDTKSALDMIWIDCLLYKLHTTLRVITNSFYWSSSRVLENCYLSKSFHIKQGNKGGSFCASFVYTVY